MVYRNYQTGIDRYIEMFMKGIDMQCNESVKIHAIYFTNDKKVLFPRVNVANNEILTVVIPFPQDEKLMFKDLFWEHKYISVICEILYVYVKNMSNIYFHYNNLFLSEFAKKMRDKFGGKVVTCLHCIPWKFNINNNPVFFNSLYQLYIDKNYTEFKEKENSKVDYNDSDAIICLSEAAKEYLINIHNVNSGKIKIVLNGLDIKVSDAAIHERKKHPIEILYVGKISKDKGTHELLYALKTIKNEGYDFRVKLAGTISTYDRNKIKTDYDALEIEILGQVSFDELQKLYSTCTIGVIPSLHEQCSYVAIEMAMFGVPMIVSDIDALGEIFEHEKTALLTPLIFDADFGLNADMDKFTKNIIRLIEDKELREKLSANVRRLYKEKFTLDRMVTQTIEVYKQLIQ
jgi:glycosyltransferase involved in cell wall biosynthesis